MTAQLRVPSVSLRASVEAHPDTNGSVPKISELNSLAVRSLNFLFDEREKLFSQRIVLTEQGFRREGTSRKRTMIALLGLQRLIESGATHTFDIASIQEAILEDTNWVKSVEDLGLLTWFTAVCAPEQLLTVLNDHDLGKALDTCIDRRQGRTRGLAWFLAGIAHARQARAQTHPDLTDVAVAAYRLLLNNQGENGIFGHMAFSRSMRRILSCRFGTFADQMYAVYGLTTFAQAFEIEEPLESALNCANSVRALQGELGQWWFLYDKRRGRIANRYPVCSVHQDGTAPTALLALEEATGQKFHSSICRGLAWIAGANELGDDMRSLDRTLIWDSIGPRTKMVRHWDTTLRFLHLSHELPAHSLSIRYEARPDHFGWLLYAFGSFGLSTNEKASVAVATH